MWLGIISSSSSQSQRPSKRCREQFPTVVDQWANGSFPSHLCFHIFESPTYCSSLLNHFFCLFVSVSSYIHCMILSKPVRGFTDSQLTMTLFSIITGARGGGFRGGCWLPTSRAVRLLLLLLQLRRPLGHQEPLLQQVWDAPAADAGPLLILSAHESSGIFFLLQFNWDITDI